MVGHLLNPSIQEAVAGSSLGVPGLHSETRSPKNIKLAVTICKLKRERGLPSEMVCALVLLIGKWREGDSLDVILG